MTTTSEAGRTARLHERDAELAQVDALLEASHDRGGALLIEAPAGLGKSSLLAAGTQRALARGAHVLTARGEELERDFPFGLAIQLYGSTITEIATTRPQLLTGAAGHAASLLTSPDRVTETDSSMLFTVLHGLHWLTVGLAEQRPVLLAIDDLQWADLPSLRFLLYQLDRAEGSRVGVLSAMRTGEPLADEVEAALVRISLRSERSLKLRPLSTTAVRSVVRELHPAATDDIGDTVAELTAGNPLLVRQLLATIEHEGTGTPESLAAHLETGAPEQTARTLGLRLRRLGSDAERLAVAVALLEPDATLQRALQLAELEPEEAAAAVNLLERAAILGPGEPLGFSHPLLRSAAAARPTSAARRLLRLRAAQILAGDGAPSAKVASHLAAAEPCGEAWALEALRDAAAAATARGAPGAAVPLLRRAVRVAEETDVQGELLIELATAETAAGEVSAAERFDEALAVIDEPRRRAEILAAQAEARWVRSDYAGAVDSFAQALAAIEDGDERLEARLVAGIGAAAALAPERAAFADQAIGDRLRQLLADPPARPSLPERVLLAYGAGQSAASVLADRDTVVALARTALGDGDPLAELGRIVIEPAAVALVLGEELDQALGLYTASLDDARERGALGTVANLLPQRGFCHLRLGLIDAALSDGEDAARAGAELPGENLAEPTGRAVVAVAQLARGDPSAAGRAVDLELGEAERRWGHLPVYGVFLTAKGRVELDAGRPAAALELLREGFERMAVAGYRNPNYFESLAETALVAHGLGDEGEARELLDADTELAERFGAPRAIGMARRALALIEGGDRGLELLAEAVDWLERSPALYDRAQVLFDYGAALRRAGRRTEARARLEESMELAHRCRAAGLAERSAAELRTLGLRPRRAARSGPDALTPSELRTARMAAAGMSNRQIAERLFLSLRTIESHLTAAYRKLGISSRRQLEGALAGDGD